VRDLPPLPAPPRIALSVVRDRTATASATGGFVDLMRVDLVARYPGGEESRPFAYDLVTRRSLDAVVIAAHFDEGGSRHVFLRSAVRPPLALRPIPPAHDGSLWELPAGLIEAGEDPEAAAARELEEELGIAAGAKAFQPLGGWAFPAPGFIAEQHFFFHVEVDPRTRLVPTEDGSALERGASIVAVAVKDALEHCRRGTIRDAKTELALHRLAERFP
jgi:ADP-ribose pyrophosphatase